MPDADAIVIGSGPNGLAAAIVLAQAGVSVLLVEAEQKLGGGVRSDELTLPGFIHDTCSAIHPMAYASPFFRSLPLERFGLEWVHPTAAVAHPFDNGAPAILERSVEATAETVGEDRDSWIRFMHPVIEAYRAIQEGFVALPRVLQHPFRFSQLGLQALRTASALVRTRFRAERARALFSGNAAHAMLPLEKHGTVGIALALMAVGQSDGWPFPRGGAQKLTDALATYFQSLGGKIQTGFRGESLEQLPPHRAVLCDFTPKELLHIAGDRLPPRYSKLLKQFRYGLGAYKMDWALDAPVPWKSPEVTRAGRCMWAERWMRSSNRRGRHGTENHPSGRSSLSGSIRCSIPRARLRASTRCGRTVTCRTDRTSICQSEWRRRSSASLRDSASAFLPATKCHRERWKRTMQTSSVATSSAA